MEIEGTVQAKRLSIKYVAIYLVQIIYHSKKRSMFDLVSGTNWTGGEIRRLTIESESSDVERVFADYILINISNVCVFKCRW